MSRKKPSESLPALVHPPGDDEVLAHGELGEQLHALEGAGEPASCAGLRAAPGDVDAVHQRRVPASGGCSPDSTPKSVVLPAPFGPTSPTVEPRGPTGSPGRGPPPRRSARSRPAASDAARAVGHRSCRPVVGGHARSPQPATDARRARLGFLVAPLCVLELAQSLPVDHVVEHAARFATRDRWPRGRTASWAPRRRESPRSSPASLSGDDHTPMMRDDDRRSPIGIGAVRDRHPHDPDDDEQGRGREPEQHEDHAHRVVVARRCPTSTRFRRTRPPPGSPSPARRAASGTACLSSQLGEELPPTMKNDQDEDDRQARRRDRVDHAGEQRADRPSARPRSRRPRATRCRRAR